MHMSHTQSYPDDTTMTVNTMTTNELRYLAEKYYIVSTPRDVDSHDLVMFVERVVASMFKQQLYPTYRVLQFIVNNVSLDREAELIEAIDNYTPQQFFSVYYLNDFLDREIKLAALPQIPQPHGDVEWKRQPYLDLTFHLSLSPGDSVYLKRLITYVADPTLYVTPWGPMQIDYDKDRREHLEAEMKTANEGFDDYVVDNFSVYERMVFFRHCV